MTHVNFEVEGQLPELRFINVFSYECTHVLLFVIATLKHHKEKKNWGFPALRFCLVCYKMHQLPINKPREESSCDLRIMFFFLGGGGVLNEKVKGNCLN